MRNLIEKPKKDRDKASIVTIAHWASYHLVSTIIDQLDISQKLKHRNHRGIKATLKQLNHIKTIGHYSTEILDLYNELESSFMVKFQYGRIGRILDETQMLEILKRLEELCKIITEKVQEGR